ncbi:hypothetical protein [Streptomyces sp. NPDC053367]|uniref:hypothetical protein n=1 Tax=Streptomyces sp. NPDC053367 TaxID=3365700 RepID=UPI0037D36C43
MPARWTRSAAAALLTAVVATGAAGCSDDDSSSSPSDVASSARSAAASVASEASAAASSFASEASDALASASAEAQRRLDEAKGGVEAKDDVQLGDVTFDGEGRATAPVTARNTADSAKSFAVQVNFEDKDGNVLDTVVITLKDVAADRSADATARSHRELSGDVRASIATALRY